MLDGYSLTSLFSAFLDCVVLNAADLNTTPKKAWTLIIQSLNGTGLIRNMCGNVSDKAELTKRTIKTTILNGQAAFFNLITSLGVPVLDKSSNQSAD